MSKLSTDLKQIATDKHWSSHEFLTNLLDALDGLDPFRARTPTSLSDHQFAILCDSLDDAADGRPVVIEAVTAIL